jgi:tRNA threonylcarbamoyladenosine biosynthesis protein TsaB
MNILALETSVACGSVALQIGDAILERTIDEPRTHAERLLPCIDQLLSEAGIRAAELDAITFGRGPGSFIGVRLASAVAQGLAAAAAVGLAPVSSMAALARRAALDYGNEFERGMHILVCLDARMNEVYLAEFDAADGYPVPRGDERLVGADALELPQQGDWIALGSGFATYPKLRAQGRFEQIDTTLEPRARDLLPFAQVAVSTQALIAPEDWRSAYLRGESAWQRTK